MSRLVSIFASSLLGVALSHAPVAFGGMPEELNDSISTHLYKVKNKASYCDVKPERLPSTKPAIMAKGASVYKGPSRICGGLGRTKSATRIKVIGTRGNWYYIEARSTRGKTIRGWAKSNTVSFIKTSKTNPSQKKNTPTYPKDMVMEVQQILDSRGYALGSIDGLFGPATKSALIAFQKDNGVKPTGKMDLDTLVLLKSKKSSPLTSSPEVKSTGSMFPEAVAWVQVDPDSGEARTIIDHSSSSSSHETEGLVIGLLKDIGPQGCGCLFNPKDSQGQVFNKYLFISDATGKAWINVNGTDTLLLEEDRNQEKGESGYCAGRRCTYSTEGMKAIVDFHETDKCPPEPTECEVTGYDVTITVERDGIRQSIIGKGKCGC